MSKCSITQDGNDLILSFPYNPDMVAHLKASIPASERKYEADKKVWRIAPSKATKIQNLCSIYFNELPSVPTMKVKVPTIKQQILEVRYIGMTKERGSMDDRHAFGWHGDSWTVSFSESVLRAWFDAPRSPSKSPTLYSVLNVKRDASEDEIKAGYRRMVMQWHPDKNREPNAQEQFMAIQNAYEVLSKKREKYDAGLDFEASLKNNNEPDAYVYRFSNIGYRSPLRCGLIMCEGHEALGVFQVSKIFAWEDIRDAQGRTLVSSWGKDDKKFTEEWV